ncbi:MAG: anaerobic ribonucleoside-triphosphate reductase [Holosporales bacterium]|jgi:hypothetical protein|nr:anaerobic ribonucleoside-triphosphate reductase [Holosporales bacterium]
MENKKIELTDDERTVCECWSRVMGFYRPVENYNAGKKSEFEERKCFKEPTADANKKSSPKN